MMNEKSLKGYGTKAQELTPNIVIYLCVMVNAYVSILRCIGNGRP